MTKHVNLKRHIYLFDMMAEKLGHDLEVAVIDGEISPEEIVEASFRCSDCAKSSTCEAALPLAREMSEPYDFCRNHALFERLNPND
ncbi:DUF6455 family protein [Cognatishimia activa]|uniref:DUF6455 family protein n=1 Tax=Cognatishimia activa TaxID=1715691 RepID=UPI0022300CA0|nr:DUF6455 family protein [Cognatishimia activa]UZD89824.1 DUF6455 family protein [Cognatishimia activa]